MSDDRREIDWSEHPDLYKIGVWSANTFNQDTSRDFDGYPSDAACLQDYKVEHINWVDERIEELQELREMIQALPDDHYDTYVEGTCEACGKEEEILVEVAPLEGHGRLWACQGCINLKTVIL